MDTDGTKMFLYYIGEEVGNQNLMDSAAEEDINPKKVLKNIVSSPNADQIIERFLKQFDVSDKAIKNLQASKKIDGFDTLIENILYESLYHPELTKGVAKTLGSEPVIETLKIYNKYGLSGNIAEVIAERAFKVFKYSNSLNDAVKIAERLHNEKVLKVADTYKGSKWFEKIMDRIIRNASYEIYDGVTIKVANALLNKKAVNAIKNCPKCANTVINTADYTQSEEAAEEVSKTLIEFRKSSVLDDIPYIINEVVFNTEDSKNNSDAVIETARTLRDYMGTDVLDKVMNSIDETAFSTKNPKVTAEVSRYLRYSYITGKTEKMADIIEALAENTKNGDAITSAARTLTVYLMSDKFDKVAEVLGAVGKTKRASAIKKTAQVLRAYKRRSCFKDVADDIKQKAYFEVNNAPSGQATNPLETFFERERFEKEYDDKRVEASNRVIRVANEYMYGLNKPN